MSCRYWGAQDKGNVDQDNNAIESLLGAVLRSYTDGDYTRAIYRETCGPSSLEACLEGLGVDQSMCGMLQPSDFYTCAMNDGRLVSREGFSQPVNRYIKAYPLLVKRLFPSVNCNVVWIGASVSKAANELKSILLAQDSVAIVNLVDPGHYVAALHIDGNDIVTYNESWMGNYWNKGLTRKRTVALADLAANMKAGIVHLWL